MKKLITVITVAMLPIFALANDLIPTSNPILQQAKEQIVERVDINLHQIPQISAVEARLLVDNKGNIVAWAAIDPIVTRQQIKAKTFRARTAEHLQENWGKWLLGAATAIAVDRVANNNDWLWYDWFGSGSSGGGSSNSGQQAQITITGDSNTVIIQQPTGDANYSVDNSNHSDNSSF